MEVLTWYFPSCFGLRVSFCFVVEVHAMMEESAAACVSGDFAQALEKGKEAVSQAYCYAVTN